jgi:hypothetical protein
VSEAISITWFSDSPDCGDPTCVCSLCGALITEDDAPAIRLFDTDTNREARFHMRCASTAGIVSLSPISDYGDDEDWS